jgi:hypothetical protein
MCSGPAGTCIHRDLLITANPSPTPNSIGPRNIPIAAVKSLRNVHRWVSRSRGDDMWSWHVGYVKRSRRHVHSPRSPHHLQPISHAQFKRTAEHTNRDHEIITQRALVGSAVVGSWHVACRVCAAVPPARAFTAISSLPPTHLQRPFQTDRGTYQIAAVKSFGGFLGHEVDRSLPACSSMIRDAQRSMVLFPLLPLVL